MKKLAIAVFALCVLGTGAFAMKLTNPLYMPGEGRIMSDTEGTFTNTRGGGSNKVFALSQSLSYGIMERLQLGAEVGYIYASDADVNGVYNPAVFGFYRIADEEITFDLGASVRLGLYETDVANRDYSYSLIARAGRDMEEFSFGCSLAFTLNSFDSDDSGSIRPPCILCAYESHKPPAAAMVVAAGSGSSSSTTTKDLGARIFGIYNIDDNMGLGAEAGYALNSMGETFKFNSYQLLARFDYIFGETTGLKFYAGLGGTDQKGDDGSYFAGAVLRLLF